MANVPSDSSVNGVAPGTAPTPVPATPAAHVAPAGDAAPSAPSAQTVKTAAAVAPAADRRKAVTSGKDVAKDAKSGRAERQNALKIAEDLAAAHAEITEQRETILATTAKLTETETALSASAAQVAALEAELAKPIAAGVPRKLPFADDVGPENAQEAHGIVIYTAEANGFKPVTVYGVRVHSWPSIEMIEVRSKKSIDANHPWGTGDIIEVEPMSPIYVPVEGPLLEVAAMMKSRPGHAFAMKIVPIAQIPTDGGVPITISRVWATDMGPGTADQVSGGPRG